MLPMRASDSVRHITGKDLAREYRICHAPSTMRRNYAYERHFDTIFDHLGW